MLTFIDADTPVISDTGPAGAPEPATGIPQDAADPLQAAFDRPWQDHLREQARLKDEWTRKSYDNIDAAILDWDTFAKGKDIPLDFAATPQEARELAIIGSYLTLHNDGQPIGGGWLGWEMKRDDIALRFFNGRGVGDNKVFYQQIAGEATRRRDSRELREKLLATAASSGLATIVEGPARAGTFSQWQEGARATPGYAPGRDYAYLEAWNDRQQEIRERTEPILPHLTGIWNAFRTGEDFGGLAGKAYRELAPEQRESLLDGLVMMSRTLPAAQQEGFWNRLGSNVAKSSGRAASGIGDAIVRSMIERFREDVDASVPWTADHEKAKEGLTKYGADLSGSLDFQDDILQVRQRDYDPLKKLSSGGFLGALEGGLYAAPGAAATSAVGMLPVVGPGLTWDIMRGQAYSTVRSSLMERKMDPAAASRYARQWMTPIAAIQFIPERLGLAALTTKIPGITALTDRLKSTAARIAAGTALDFAVEGGTELFQDFVPGLVQEIAAYYDEKVPDYVWRNGRDGFLDHYGTSAVETLVAILPLAIFGGFKGADMEERRTAFSRSSRLEREAFGIRPEDNDAIDAALTPSELTTAIDRAMENRNPRSLAARQAVLLLDDQAARRAAAADLLRGQGVTPRMVYNERTKDWTLYDMSTGAEIGKATDAGSAARLAAAHTRATEEADATRVAALAARMQVTAPAAGKEGEATTGAAPATKEEANPQSIATTEDIGRTGDALEAREILQGGDGGVSQTILGPSSTHRRKLKSGISGTIHRLLSGDPAATALHEGTSRFWKDALTTGSITRQEAVTFLKAVDTVLSTRDGGKGRDGGTTSLLPVNGADITDTHLDGAIAHIHEAEILRTPGNKDSLPSGLISRHLPAIARIAGERTAGKFKALFDATRSSFRIALEQATSLRQTLAGRGASVTALPDGTFRVTDSQGNEIGIAEDAEGVARIGEAHGGSDPQPKTETATTPSEDVITNGTENVIYERRSKARKRERDPHRKDWAEAKAIFDKVLDLSSSRMTNEESENLPKRKMLHRGKLETTPEERMILDSRYEIMLVYSKDGRLKNARLGSKTKSGIPPHSDDDTLSHNHPGGRGPSDSDIEYALANPGITLRIVARNESGSVEIFQIRTKKRISKDEITVIGRSYHEACKVAGDNHMARRKAVGLILERFGDTLEITTTDL